MKNSAKIKKKYKHSVENTNIFIHLHGLHITWTHPTSNAFIEPAKSATFPWSGINSAFKSSPRWFLMILRVCNILYWKELLGFNIIIEVNWLGFYFDARLVNPFVYCVLTFEALKSNNKHQMWYYITYCCLHLNNVTNIIAIMWYLIGIRLHRSSKECSAACTRTSSIVIMGSRLTHSTNWTWHWYMNFRLHFRFIFIDFFFYLNRWVFINASLILT